MDIAKQIDRVRSIVGPEKAEELSEVLNEMKVEVIGLIDNVKDASAESKARKLKIRSMQTDMNNYETDIAELTTKADTSELTKEIEKLRDFQKGVVEESRNSFINRFEKIKDNPKLEKASQYFNLPEANEKGALKWDEIDNDAMASNLAEIKKLENLDYFDQGKPEIKKSVAGENVPTGVVDINSRIQNAKTMEELNAINDEMAGA
tara:strand:+ start:153 stop:770 length:618 start_codon:yes stop_codon:yes gene_type:complete